MINIAIFITNKQLPKKPDSISELREITQINVLVLLKIKLFTNFTEPENSLTKPN
jgi:hypothetical protein